LAPVLSPWIWPLIALAAGFGAYQMVSAKGCAPGCGESGAAQAGLGEAQRRRRIRMGLRFLAAGIALAAVAWCDLVALWPLAGIVLWFGASFLVAARTGYAGCPEVGAIPSWLLGRPIATRCPPLERLDRRGAGDQ
jgi:hypothetical protein